MPWCGGPAAILPGPAAACLPAVLLRLAQAAASDAGRPAKTGLLGRLLQALTGSTPAGQGSSSDDEDDYGPPSGSSGGSLSGSRAGPAQQEQEQHGQGPPESASAASVTTEPPPGLLLAATAAGLAALPVVVWSEWVLKTTGADGAPGGAPGG